MDNFSRISLFFFIALFMLLGLLGWVVWEPILQSDRPGFARAATLMYLLLSGLVVGAGCCAVPIRSKRGAIGGHSYTVETSAYWVAVVYRGKRYRFDGFADAGIGPDAKPVLAKRTFYYAFNVRRPELKIATPHSNYKGEWVDD